MEQRLCLLQSKSARERAYRDNVCAAGKIRFGKNMRLVLVFVVGLVASARGGDHGQVVEPGNDVGPADGELDGTDLVLAFAIFRHGDRTPDQEELVLYTPPEQKNKDIFFPYGKKALTNRGKQRGYKVGEYLRHRYDGFISRLYFPEEISVRTTNYDRTKMTALTALAGMYPPLPSQQWNPNLDWQPIPYTTVDGSVDDEISIRTTNYDHTKMTALTALAGMYPPLPSQQWNPNLDWQPIPYTTVDGSVDDLMYWYNCPQYLRLRDEAYSFPEVVMLLKTYEDLFPYLSKRTHTNITKAEDVFFLDNLLQTLENVGIDPPEWAEKVMPKIKEVTKIEYEVEFFTAELTKIATGVLMSEILNATDAAIAGDKSQPKLRLYSAHENNVAALMAAARVFQAHQPNYGSTFSLELRRHKDTGKYGIAAVYAATAGGPAEVLPVNGCDNHLLCDYDTFVTLMKDILWSPDDFRRQCLRDLSDNKLVG